MSLESTNKIGFYIIHNTKTDELYVGSGVLKKRLGSHRNALVKNKHENYKLQEAYNRDPNFDFIGVPIDEGTPIEQRELALAFEQSTIDELKGNPLLLNIAMNVVKPMTGLKHSEENNKRNSDSALQRWKDPNWRIKVSKSMKDGWDNLSSEEKSLINQNKSFRLKEDYANGTRVSTAGQFRSQDFKNNNSNKIKELWKNPEYRETQLQARVGKMIGPKKAVIIDGVEYISMTLAAQVTGMTIAGLAYRLDNPKFPNWIKDVR